MFESLLTLLRTGRTRPAIPDRWKYVPTGNPEADISRLTTWWREEVVESGLNGTVTVHYAPFSSEQTWDWWESTVKGALYNATQLQAQHAFITDLPGPRTPIHSVILTTDEGVITRVIYRTRIRALLQSGNTMRVKKAVGWITPSTIRIEGQRAEEWQRNRPLAKLLNDSLSISYSLFKGTFIREVSSRIEAAPAVYEFQAADSGTDVTVYTLPRTGSVKEGITFDLTRFVAVLSALEQMAAG